MRLRIVRHTRHRRIAMSAGLLALAAFAWNVKGQEGTEQGRGAFMRRKLDHAQGLIEGLALADFGQIRDNARALKALSLAAEWEAPFVPDVDQYIPYTMEFQRACDDLIRHADAKDLDGATVANVRLTLNCVRCHKYVRSGHP